MRHHPLFRLGGLFAGILFFILTPRFASADIDMSQYGYKHTLDDGFNISSNGSVQWNGNFGMDNSGQAQNLGVNNVGVGNHGNNSRGLGSVNNVGANNYGSSYGNGSGVNNIGIGNGDATHSDDNYGSTSNNIGANNYGSTGNGATTNNVGIGNTGNNGCYDNSAWTSCGYGESSGGYANNVGANNVGDNNQSESLNNAGFGNIGNNGHGGCSYDVCGDNGGGVINNAGGNNTGSTDSSQNFYDYQQGVGQCANTESCNSLTSDPGTYANNIGYGNGSAGGCASSNNYGGMTNNLGTYNCGDNWGNGTVMNNAGNNNNGTNYSDGYLEGNGSNAVGNNVGSGNTGNNGGWYSDCYQSSQCRYDGDMFNNAGDNNNGNSYWSGSWYNNAGDGQNGSGHWGFYDCNNSNLICIPNGNILDPRTYTDYANFIAAQEENGLLPGNQTFFGYPVPGGQATTLAGQDASYAGQDAGYLGGDAGYLGSYCTTDLQTYFCGIDPNPLKTIVSDIVYYNLCGTKYAGDPNACAGEMICGPQYPDLLGSCLNSITTPITAGAATVWNYFQYTYFPELEGDLIAIMGLASTAEGQAENFLINTVDQLLIGGVSTAIQQTEGVLLWLSDTYIPDDLYPALGSIYSQTESFLQTTWTWLTGINQFPLPAQLPPYPGGLNPLSSPTPPVLRPVPGAAAGVLQ